MRFRHILILCVAFLLTACASTPEQRFQAHGRHFSALAGPTDEPSCGGTWEVVWIGLNGEGDHLTIGGRIYWRIETSRRIIERDYYGSLTPLVVIETSHYLLDSEANRLKTPRFEYTRRYDLTKPGAVPPEKKDEFEKHADYLLRYFGAHEKEFKHLSASEAAAMP